MNDWREVSVRVCAFLIAVLTLPLPAIAAQDTGRTTSAEPTNWAPPRTPWGDPDLQGIWNNTVNTPLERPEALAGQEFLTEEEVATREARRDAERAPRAGDTGTYNNFWRDSRILSTRTLGCYHNTRSLWNIAYHPGKNSLYVTPSVPRPMSLDDRKRSHPVWLRTAFRCDAAGYRPQRLHGARENRPLDR